MVLPCLKLSSGQDQLLEVCPYCGLQAANSRDHIFPDFLGGSRTVWCCKPCNDRFGYQVEAAVNRDLSSLIVAFSVSGYAHPRTVVWKEAFTDPETDAKYDLDSKSSAKPSRPYKFIDNKGRTRGRARSKREAMNFGKTLGEGHIVFQEQTTTGLRPTLHHSRLHLGSEIRTLACKMCVALATTSDNLGKRRNWRPGEIAKQHPPLLLPTRIEALDDLRPPLGHLIYIEGDPVRGRSYGIVQFFGCSAQFYVLLDDKYEGSKFAQLATLDIRSFEEKFSEVVPIELITPSRFQDTATYLESMRKWPETLNSEIERAFGAVGLKVNLGVEQLIKGLQTTVPLVWTEVNVHIDIEVAFAGNEAAHVQMDLPPRPVEWKFSNDVGLTYLSVVEPLIAAWNDFKIEPRVDVVPALKATVPVGTQLLVNSDTWIGVESVEFQYRVTKRSWLGEILLTDQTATFHEITYPAPGNIKCQIPLTSMPSERDDSWPEIDALTYLADHPDTLHVERRRRIDLPKLSCPFAGVAPE